MGYDWSEAALSLLGNSGGSSSGLDEVTQQLAKINQQLQGIQNSLADLAICLVLVEVDPYVTNLLAMQTLMTTYIAEAPNQPTATTQADIDQLVVQIKQSAYQDALGIYNAMTQGDDPAHEGLQFQFQTLYQTGMDALALYGSIKSFAMKYLVVTRTGATLLVLASKATKDVALQQLDDDVSLWTQPWNDSLQKVPSLGGTSLRIILEAKNGRFSIFSCKITLCRGTRMECFG
ncbi:hypothetical protein NLJ89_g9500 [Agrocybe chaxingu]|uniref:Uncharacterized protein n=1 Tax=Agrocybe chaxingu TaxID=84603 RepID=A0A9W8K0G3_9AGAR|nr:hypothetical protein NLJ89_g9500 [Agrocybe chaxingu]